MAAQHRSNPVARLFWRLEDRHPEALAIGILTAVAVAANLAAMVLI
jgi:hypothetical protein